MKLTSVLAVVAFTVTAFAAPVPNAEAVAEAEPGFGSYGSYSTPYSKYSKYGKYGK